MLQCILLTPEKPVCQQQAEFVALPLQDGEIGIAPKHTPLVGRVGCGELRIRAREGTRRFYVEGGFVEVVGDVVSVLADRAVPAEQIDAAVAAEQLQQARRRPARTAEEFARRDHLAAVARAQLRVARRLAR